MLYIVMIFSIHMESKYLRNFLSNFISYYITQNVLYILLFSIEIIGMLKLTYYILQEFFDILTNSIF